MVIPAELQPYIQAAKDAFQDYSQTGQIAALNRAVADSEIILRSAAFKEAGSDFQAVALNETGVVFLSRYWAQGDIKDLDKALEWIRQALALTPEDSPNRAEMLNTLSNLLTARYEHVGDPSDLEKAIGAAEQALTLTPEGSPDRARYLKTLDLSLSDRYERSGDLSDLEKAIETAEQAVALTPEGSPSKAGYFSNLSSLLADRYERVGELEDLERALDWTQQAVALTAEGSPDRAMYLNTLSLRLIDRYHRSGELSDLEAAIRAAEQALALEGSPDKPAILNNLSNMLAERYERRDKLSDLEAAIEAAKQAVALTPEGSPDRAAILNNLSNVLAERYERSDKLSDLEAAIEAAKQAVALTPEGSPDKAGQLNNLSNMLADRYERVGELEDLERALDWTQQAVALTAEGSQDRAAILNTLSLRLIDRYHRSGELSDLEAATRAFERALALTPEGSPVKAGQFNNLSNMLSERYERSGELADLEVAIQASQQAVALTPEGSPDRAMVLNNLGNRLFYRYELSGELSDLEAAIQAAKQAVELTPEGSPDRAGRLNNLGPRLADRYHRSGELSDLEAAIQAAKQAVALTPEGAPYRAMYLTTLGHVLAERYRSIGDPVDLEKGQNAYRQALKLGQGVNPENVIMSSRNWGSWALERRSWEEAAQAFQPGLETITTLVRQQALRASKESWLREAQGIPARYAFALARLSQPEQALEALESGRAHLLSEQLARTQIDLQALMRVAPELARQYQDLTSQASGWYSTELQQSQDTEQVQTALSQINQQLLQLGEQIREVPGFERFLATITLADIYQATQGQPIAYLAATPAGGMALLALPDSRVEVRWFAGLIEERLFEEIQGSKGDPRLGGYLGAYQGWKDSLDPEIKASPEEKELAFNQWLEALQEITHWLWQAGMGELTGWLVKHGFSQCTLVPMGLLTLLPLHAAWRKDKSAPTGYRYAQDEVLFSYAPNALALLSAQEKAGHPAELILVVENPNSDHPQLDIPFSGEVSQAALEYFPGDQHQYLPGEQASRERVIEQMPEVNVVHFWTHGLSNPRSPLESSLLLASEERLSLKDILPLDLPNARLAILSACETGMAGIRNIDEVIALPSGFLQAGVPGVVGSLWSVAAVSTMMLVSRFYELWRGEQKLAAPHALAAAQAWVRDTTNQEKVDYYQAWVDNAGQAGMLMMPVQAARVAFNEMLTKNPSERDFAHPFFWAAFAYFGT